MCKTSGRGRAADSGVFPAFTDMLNQGCEVAQLHARPRTMGSKQEMLEVCGLGWMVAVDEEDEDWVEMREVGR
jgi:hypothetical protein